MLRRGIIVAIAAVLAVAAIGCGKKEEEVVIADPVAEALAHAPADAAALALVATDTSEGPGATLAALTRRFPGSQLVLGQAQSLVAGRLGVDYAELAPLLGHPVVAWSADGTLQRPFAAWVTADAGKLGELLDARESSKALVAAGTDGDYVLFTRRDGAAYARRGPVLLLAPDLASLRQVLARRRAGRGQWSERLLRERSLGLPGGSVARVALDARALVARRAGAARRIPWVAALDRAALTVTPEAGGLRVRARAGTGARELAAGDVPIAPGVEPPVTRGRGPITAAVRGPRQTLEFVRRTLDLLDPQRLDGLREAEQVLDRFARVSLQEDVLDRLTGSATLTSRDGRSFTVRSDLDDPGRTADALGRLGTLSRFGGPLASLAGVDLGGIAVDEQDGRYRITRDGRLLVALAVVDGALVASTDPAADLGAAGRAGASPPAPTAGAFRATVAAALLKDELFRRLGLPDFARAALAPLRDPIVTARGERQLFDVQVVLLIAR